MKGITVDKLEAVEIRTLAYEYIGLTLSFETQGLFWYLGEHFRKALNSEGNAEVYYCLKTRFFQTYTDRKNPFPQ